MKRLTIALLSTVLILPAAGAFAQTDEPFLAESADNDPVGENRGVDRTNPATQDDAIATGENQDVIETPSTGMARDDDGGLLEDRDMTRERTADEPFLAEAADDDPRGENRGVDRTNPVTQDDTIATGENQDVIETPGG